MDRRHRSGQDPAEPLHAMRPVLLAGVAAGWDRRCGVALIALSLSLRPLAEARL